MNRYAAGRERDYRFITAVMALLAGGEDVCGDPDVMVLAGRRIRELAETQMLFAIITIRGKNCIYIETPSSDAISRPPRAHVILWREGSGTSFDLVEHCSLWAGDDTSPLRLVSPQGKRGYFEMCDGHFIHRDGLPPGNLAAGIVRASARLRATMRDLRGVKQGLEDMPTKIVKDLEDLKSFLHRDGRT